MLNFSKQNGLYIVFYKNIFPPLFMLFSSLVVGFILLLLGLMNFIFPFFIILFIFLIFQIIILIRGKTLIINNQEKILIYDSKKIGYSDIKMIRLKQNDRGNIVTDWDWGLYLKLVIVKKDNTEMSIFSEYLSWLRWSGIGFFTPWKRDEIIESIYKYIKEHTNLPTEEVIK